MARMRTIKPEFWTDDEIVDLDLLAKLLYIGLWNFADDDGYIEASPRRIKRLIFPDSDYDVPVALDALVKSRRIGVFESDQGRIYGVLRFKEHQRPQHPTPTKFSNIRAVSVTPPEDSRELMKAHSVEEGSSRGGEDVPDDRPDVSRLCNLLADEIQKNGSKRPPIGQGWLDAARLMIDRDKRDPDKAANLIVWCQSNDFWRSAVLSMPKFREQYDQLRLQALREHEKQKPKADPDAWMNR